ncbi:MAG: acetate--CoA ligase family protein [Deltaproteobacteria bacterium]|nr:acetate--CoA ligase family protein [Candidatus Anaeroferrophillacea bacterium]
MERLFHPRSLLIVGVSANPRNLARNIVYNLLEFGYDGRVVLMGKEEGNLLGHRIHTEFSEIPANLDLAVILTPAVTVPGIMRGCIARGIRRMVIETGGFSEFSAAGAALEAELLGLAREHEVKFVGPNGISIINRHTGLCLPFMRLRPRDILPGGLSILAQSGGMALTYMGLGRSENVGVAKVVSMGNKTSLDEIDYLDYLRDDAETTVIGLYLESIRNGRGLLDAALRTGKPVLLHKSNTSAASQQIARSHTAALANDDQVVDAACRQFGIHRVRTFRQFINQVKSFNLPPMRGDRLVVISRSGGHAVVAADAASDYGFELVPFSDDFIDFIRGRFRAQVINPTNPLDLGDLFDIDFYVTILAEVLKRSDVDGVLFNHVFQEEVEGESSQRLAETLHRLSREYDKPVALCVFSGERAVARLKANLDFPLFTEPAEGIEALAVSRDSGRRQPAAVPVADVVPAAARLDLPPIREIVAGAAARGSADLFLDEALAVFRAAGMPVTPAVILPPGREMVTAAVDLPSFPLAVKAVAAELSHKSDAGAVALDIDSPEKLAATVADFAARFGSLPGYRGLLVQPMVFGAVELIVGGRRDAAFGPVVVLGMGGIYAEVFQDVAIRLSPLDDAGIDEMIASLRGAPIIAGTRGRPGIDRQALHGVIHAVTGLLAAAPEIRQLDLNPVTFTAAGATVVDGRIFLSA